MAIEALSERKAFLSSAEKLQIDITSECIVCFDLFSDKINAGKNRFYGHEVSLPSLVGRVGNSLRNRMFHIQCQDCSLNEEARIVEGSHYAYQGRCPLRCESFGIYGREEFVVDADGEIIERRSRNFPEIGQNRAQPPRLLVASWALMIFGGVAFCMFNEIRRSAFVMSVLGMVIFTESSATRIESVAILTGGVGGFILAWRVGGPIASIGCLPPISSGLAGLYFSAYARRVP